jgi:molecular chaperone HtpG
MADNFKPVIGKNVLETLTTGMYDDARFIFREYIQNAADQIDLAVEENILAEKSKGEINIDIDATNKRISITDNATGVSTKNILHFLGDVANSQKDRAQRKGFRGIGRLGGLGYCDKLIFETSYKGEAIKTKMTLDAKQLRRIILDKKEKADAATVISVITTIKEENEAREKHYFRVILENACENVLEVKSVEEYLSMVAPVPFSEDFSYSYDIKTYFENKNIVLDEYNVVINENTLFKAYKDEFKLEDGSISKWIGVDFIEIRNDENKLLALCWYGYRDLSNVVLPADNIEQGIRIRTKNIAIGDEFTCDRFFEASRTNHRFIGEIHTIGDSFIPNARRDYFVENNTCLQFAEMTKEIFESANLENRLAQVASKLHNRIREIERYSKIKKEFKAMEGSFQSASVEAHHLNNLKDAKAKAIKAYKDIEKIRVKTLKDSNIDKLYKHIIGNKKIAIAPDEYDSKKVSKYDPPSLSKLPTKEEQQVVLDIFDILEETLTFEESELLKMKIIEWFNS